jgi:glycosyltransferase involved in cell wall biosynthesis
MNLNIGFVSTYQPTNCGIATFTASLMNSMNAIDSYSAKVIRLLDAPKPLDPPAPLVIATIVSGDRSSISRAASTLNSMDIAVIQHEFGIYGGPDGVEVLTLVNQLRVPAIVVLHTVLSAPSPHQREIIQALCERAAAVVVMSKIARHRLIADPMIDPSKILLIHHGSRRIISHVLRNEIVRPVILTWGLISPGKGIEWVIAAMEQLQDIQPAPIYIVAGRTHPKVLESQGEIYRESLENLVDELSLRSCVELRSAFLNNDALDNLLATASIVVLPYDNCEQVTSGVLVEAVSAGRPIVATRFPHAVELLENEVGILVPQRDPNAIAQALRKVLTDSDLAEEMSRRTRVIAREIQWPVVAREYANLASSLMVARVSA